MAAVGHDQRDVVSGGFHHVGDEGMADAMAGESISLTIVEFWRVLRLYGKRALWRYSPSVRPSRIWSPGVQSHPSENGTPDIQVSNSRGGIVASLCQLLFLGVLLDPVRPLTKEQGHTKWRRFQNLAGGLAVRAFLIVCLIGLFAYGVGWVGGEPAAYGHTILTVRQHVWGR